MIVNKGDLRLYYFSKENKVYSFPIGIGRGDWETPTGKARITGKKKKPLLDSTCINIRGRTSLA